MSVCVVSGVRGFGKEQSKCFWIEDYRPARSRERDSRSLRSARGKVGRGSMRSGCSAEEDEEEGGRAEGKGWRGRETARVHLRITILIQKQSRFRFPRSSSVLKFSQFLHTWRYNFDIPPDSQQGPYTGEIHPVFVKVIWYQVLKFCFFAVFTCFDQFPIIFWFLLPECISFPLHSVAAL